MSAMPALPNASRKGRTERTGGPSETFLVLVLLVPDRGCGNGAYAKLIAGKCNSVFSSLDEATAPFTVAPPRQDRVHAGSGMQPSKWKSPSAVPAMAKSFGR